MNLKDSEILKIRKAAKEDMLKYFSWANDEEVRKASFHSHKISLSEHIAWFEKKIYDPDTFMYVFESEGNLAGQVRIEKHDKAVIGISIDKNSRGKGFASQMLKMSIDFFRKTNDDPIYAYIRKDNSASVKSFENAGFIFLEDGMVNKIECYVYILYSKG